MISFSKRVITATNCMKHASTASNESAKSPAGRGQVSCTALCGAHSAGRTGFISDQARIMWGKRSGALARPVFRRSEFYRAIAAIVLRRRMQFVDMRDRRRVALDDDIDDCRALEEQIGRAHV